MVAPVPEYMTQHVRKDAFLWNTQYGIVPVLGCNVGMENTSHKTVGGRGKGGRLLDRETFNILKKVQQTLFYHFFRILSCNKH